MRERVKLDWQQKIHCQFCIFLRFLWKNIRILQLYSKTNSKTKQQKDTQTCWKGKVDLHSDSGSGGLKFISRTSCCLVVYPISLTVYIHPFSGWVFVGLQPNIDSVTNEGLRHSHSRNCRVRSLKAIIKYSVIFCWCGGSDNKKLHERCSVSNTPCW